MKLITFLLALTIWSNCFADVELAVKANNSWRDNLPTTSWTKADFVVYWQGFHKGEIVDVFAGGTKFGKLDIPPAIIQVTVTGIDFEKAKSYLDPVLDTLQDSIMVTQRKFYFTETAVDSAVAYWNNTDSAITITREQALVLIKKYDLAVVKQKIIDGVKK